MRKLRPYLIVVLKRKCRFSESDTFLTDEFIDIGKISPCRQTALAYANNGIKRKYKAFLCQIGRVYDMQEQRKIIHSRLGKSIVHCCPVRIKYFRFGCNEYALIEHILGHIIVEAHQIPISLDCLIVDDLMIAAADIAFLCALVYIH